MEVILATFTYDMFLVRSRSFFALVTFWFAETINRNQDPGFSLKSQDKMRLNVAVELL